MRLTIIKQVFSTPSRLYVREKIKKFFLHFFDWKCLLPSKVCACFVIVSHIKIDIYFAANGAREYGGFITWS